MKSLFLLMKRSMTLETSLKLPYLLIDCVLINLFSLFSGTDLIKSVFIGVGPIRFTVIPNFPNSFDKIFLGY